jgi:hypothetical protein
MFYILHLQKQKVKKEDFVVYCPDELEING